MEKLIGETSAICPHCRALLQKMPGRKTMCPSCQQPILVRTRPQDRQRVLVTPSQAGDLSEDWGVYNSEQPNTSRAGPRSGRISTDGGLPALQRERAEWFIKEIRRYQSDKVERVKMLVASDACEFCLPHSEMTYCLDECPKIPVCDDCRCCIAPVVD